MKHFYHFVLAAILACFSLGASAQVTAKLHEYKNWVVCLTFSDYAEVDYDYNACWPIRIYDENNNQLQACYDAAMDDDQTNMVLCYFDDPIEDGTYTVRFEDGTFLSDPWGSAVKVPGGSVTLVVGDDGEPAPFEDHWQFVSSDPADGATVDGLSTITLYYPEDVCGAGLAQANFYAVLTGDNGYRKELEFVENGECTYQRARVPGGLTEPGTYTLTIPQDILTAIAGIYDHNKAQTFTWTIAGEEPAPAEELYVVSLTSSAAGGIVLTFNDDLMVSHSAFGAKCYTQFDDLDGDAGRNAKPTVNGNVVTLTQQYCTFIDGHRYLLVLNPACFTLASNPYVTLSGQNTFEFVMGEGTEAPSIVATQVTPSNGTRTNIANVTLTFEPGLTAINNKDGISIHNENGHTLPLARVDINKEGGLSALNINVNTDIAEYEGGTTYKVYIAPGAIQCGDVTNADELVFGEWYIKPAPLALVCDPAADTLVESISTVTVCAADGLAFDYVGTEASDICITGVMEDQEILYARATSVVPTADELGYVITFDNVVEPDDIVKAGALYNSVKIVIPAGTFRRGVSENNAFQAIWTVQEVAELGEVTWTFDPEAGSQVKALGRRVTTSDEDGTVTSYYIDFTLAGENLYADLSDASAFRILNEATGATVMTFGKYDVFSTGANAFSLELSKQIVEDGEYTLVIPADAVNYYTDANHYSEPQHPAADIEVTWTVNSLLGIQGIALDAATAPVYDLSGRRAVRPAGITITSGRKAVVK